MTFSKSETGHVMNVAKMSSIRDQTTALGTVYNPPKDYLQSSALITTVALGEAALGAVDDLKGRLSAKKNERKALFAEMPLIATNVIDLLVVANASKATLEDAYGVNKKIRGQRAHAKKAVDADGTPSDDTTASADVDAKTISVSQRSFVNLAAHFARMVSIARAEPGYASNEYEFSISGLDEYAARLKNVNAEVQSLAIDALTAQTVRDELLYKDVIGMYDMSIAIKHYVRRLLGFRDPRYIAISKVNLTKNKKRR